MNGSLDVLLTESHRGLADGADLALRAAGHRVHRCFDPEVDGFPCVAMADPAACPLEGPVDVALVMRRGVIPHPTPLEHGVSCAIRAGMLLVEHGSDVLDPFDQWVTTRVPDDDVAGACEWASARGGALERTVEGSLEPLLQRAGLDLTQVYCHLQRQNDRMIVHLVVSAPLDRMMTEALAVRAHSALRDERRPEVKTIDVAVHQLEAA